MTADTSNAPVMISISLAEKPFSFRLLPVLYFCSYLAHIVPGEIVQLDLRIEFHLTSPGHQKITGCFKVAQWKSGFEILEGKQKPASVAPKTSPRCKLSDVGQFVKFCGEASDVEVDGRENSCLGCIYRQFKVNGHVADPVIDLCMEQCVENEIRSEQLF